MTEGASIPLERSAAGILRPRPEQPRGETRTGCLEGVHSVVCVPTPKVPQVEAPEIN